EGAHIHYGSSAYPDWKAVKGFFEQTLENPDRDKFEVLNEKILCFRAFDLRNRFEEPFTTFREALEALQSDVAYLPEMAGSIVCYFKNATSIEIPEHFYIEAKPHFSSREKAVEWLQERKQKHDNGSLDSRLCSGFYEEKG
ncbi:hypothetical protein, partial [Oleiphilus sp. HI0079]|uniref:hypothetical protein n=1 Tax=Oleiphilus sp. HI0079 TaxID=1822254 RepID=UPI001E5D5469